MSNRRSVPHELAAALLLANWHTCCICRDRRKHVILHHLDGDPEMSSWENLAVVCHDCHSRVSGDEGLGRRFSPEEVGQYKALWEKVCSQELGNSPSRNLTFFLANPVRVYVTSDPKEIGLLFRPPKPQKDFPVSAAVFAMQECVLPSVELVRILIPDWQVDVRVVEGGQAMTVNQFWYEDNRARPNGASAEMTVEGTRRSKLAFVFYDDLHMRPVRR